MSEEPGRSKTATEPGDGADARETTELRSAARGGAATLLGASFSAVMGLVLSLVLARLLGASGSGLVMQAIAVFTIALTVARLGMDTAAVWLLPRLKMEAPQSVRGACVALLLSAFVAGVLLSLLWFVLIGIVDRPGAGNTLIVDSVSATAVMLPVGAVMLVALAATRGLGMIAPFNLIGNVALPAMRPCAIAVAVVSGGSVVAATWAWAWPLLPAAVASLWVLKRQIRQFEALKGVTGPIVPDRALRRRVFGFAVPRTLSATLEQSVLWLDIVLVGVIAGPAAAGVYGVVSRFVSAGLVVSTALRIVVAPRFSAHLAEGRRAELQELFTVTAGWIVLLGAPMYVGLACFAPTVMNWLGPDFSDGVAPMTLLCLGSLLVLAAGNVQSLLLMTGRSGWVAGNKGVVLVFNIVGNLVAIPHYGALGAAAIWAASMALDTLLAVVQVRCFTGLRLPLARIGTILLIASGCAAVPSLAAIALLGHGGAALAVATPLTGLCVGGYALISRKSLQVDVLLMMGR